MLPGLNFPPNVRLAEDIETPEEVLEDIATDVLPCLRFEGDPEKLCSRFS